MSEMSSFKIPAIPTNRVVVVRNISPSVSSKDLTDFFSYCGSILQLEVLKDAEDPQGNTQKALIEFSKEQAASTAMILSNAYLGDSPIQVDTYFSEIAYNDPAMKKIDLEGQRERDLEQEKERQREREERERERKEQARKEKENKRKEHGDQENKEEQEEGDEDVFEDALDYIEEEPSTLHLSQEDKPKVSVIVELLANGYVLNDKIIDRAKEFDDKHGITDAFRSYFIAAQNKGIQLDEKYQITERGTDLAQKAVEKTHHFARSLDEKYHVKDKIHVVKEDVQKRASQIDDKYHVKNKLVAAKNTAFKYADQAKSSETGQKVQGFLVGALSKAKSIHSEAKRVATEKEAQKEGASSQPSTPI